MLRRTLVGSGLGASAALLAWLAGTLGLAASLEDRTYDRRLVVTARPAEARQDIALIKIDESSLRALEPVFGRWPWPRVVHAAAIDFLAHAGARVVAYDVLFTEPDTRSGFPVGGRTMTGAESDAALAASTARAGNVVLLAEATFEGIDDRAAAATPAVPPPLPGTTYRAGSGFEKRPPILLPFAELAAGAAAVGHNYLVKESDGSVRRVRPFIENQGVTIPSLGMAAALAADHVAADAVRLDSDTLSIDRTSGTSSTRTTRSTRTTNIPLLSDPVPPRTGEPSGPSRQALVRFRGPSVLADTANGTSTYPTYSFFNVLLSADQISSGQPPAVDPAVFRDKIVFIGTTFAGANDLYATPFNDAAMPGIQLHAAVADDVLSNRFMRRASRVTDAAVTVLAGVAAGVIATVLPVAWATVAVIAVLAGLAAWLTHCVGAGVWIAVVQPSAAAGLALFGGVAWQYFVEGRQKREIKRLFGRYVSKDVFDHLVADPSLARLGGVRREMTVLFSDIRGFTTASEQGTPEAVVLQLNEYFTAMVDILFRHQGTLDKFVGDMVMGLFGAPMPDPRHADHAVETAIEMMSALAALNARWLADGRPTLDIGIGINSGEMIAGNIGSDAIMSYTVIGDAVNLGSRLESLNKTYGTHILISEATRERLTIGVETRRVDSVVVKGKTQAVMVYEVVTGRERAS